MTFTTIKSSQPESKGDCLKRRMKRDLDLVNWGVEGGEDQLQHCHHQHNTASKESAWDSRCLSESPPLTAAATEGAARNTRKTSNPLWLRVFIPRQWFPIFFCGCKTPSFHCSWQGASCSGWCWQKKNGLTAIACECIKQLMVATVLHQGWRREARSGLYWGL